MSRQDGCGRASTVETGLMPESCKTGRSKKRSAFWLMLMLLCGQADAETQMVPVGPSCQRGDRGYVHVFDGRTAFTYRDIPEPDYIMCWVEPHSIAEILGPAKNVRGEL